MARKIKEVEPVPPFRVGDELTTIFKPLFYIIPDVCKVLSVRQTTQCASGWMVTVDVIADGATVQKELDSFHFTKATT